MALGNIRKRISDNATELKEGGAAALGTLILGGSKAEAAMAGVGQAVLTKLVGPLGKFVGLAAMATKGIYNMTKAWATMGTGAASKLETVQNQLRVMLKGLDAAKQRVRELRNFSIATPFKMGDIVQGNRALQSLSRGALVTKQAMTLVGDAAAQAGVGFEDMAVYVGRLYDGLAGGRPVGEVLFRLAELGVISGTARTSLEKLQESGAGFSEVWRVVEGELKRSTGTMAYTSKTLEGLQSTLEDTQDELKATFSEHFMDGQKAAIEAQIKTMENLKPVVNGLGSAYSGVVTVTNTFLAKLMAAATSVPGVSKVLEFLARTVGLLSASLLALGAATGIATATSKLLALGSAATITGRGLLFLSGVMGALRAALVFLVTGPMAVLTGVLVVVGALWSMQADKVARAAAELREYEGATKSLVAQLEAQARAIRTLDQLSASYNSTLDALAQAERDYAAKRAVFEERQKEYNLWKGSSTGENMRVEMEAAKGEMQAADGRRAAIRSQVRELNQINPANLETSPQYAEAQRGLLANQRAEAEAALESSRQNMSPTALADSLAAEAQELAERRGRAETEINGTEAFRATQSEIGKKQVANRTEQARVEGEMGIVMNTDPAKYQELAEALSELQAEQQALEGATYAAAMAQDSELVKLQAQINLYNAYQAQIEAVAKAEDKLREAQAMAADDKGRSAAIQEASNALYEERRRRDAMQGAYNASGMDANKAQAAQNRIEVKTREAQGDLLNKPEQIRKEMEAKQARQRAEDARNDAVGNLRTQVTQETKGDFAAGMAALQIEQEKLDLAKQRGQIEEAIYNVEKLTLESRKRMLEREKVKREESVRDELAVVQAEESGGSMAAAESRLKLESQQLDMARARSEIEEEVYQRKRAQIEAEQRMLAQRKAQALAENAAGVEAGGLNLRAQAERLRGRGDKARELEEQAKRAEEDAGMAGRTREIMDSTGLGEDAAKQQAQQEIERARQSRGMEREGGLLQALLGRGTVVDSMQRIGGGGGVGGGPDIKKVVERLDKLIRAVENNKPVETRLGG